MGLAGSAIFQLYSARLHPSLSQGLDVIEGGQGGALELLSACSWAREDVSTAGVITIDDQATAPRDWRRKAVVNHSGTRKRPCALGRCHFESQDFIRFCFLRFLKRELHLLFASLCCLLIFLKFMLTFLFRLNSNIH